MATPQRKPSGMQSVTLGPNRYVRRDEAADMLGVSVQTLLGHERRGRITPHWAVAPDSTGRLRNTPLYTIEDVLKLPRKPGNLEPENPDELCARAFEAFEAGKSLREIVILLRVGYSRLVEIHEQWRDSGGVAMELSEGTRKALETKLGPFSSADELVEKVKAL